MHEHATLGFVVLEIRTAAKIIIAHTNPTPVTLSQIISGSSSIDEPQRILATSSFFS
jgi:hypothetical protein